MSANTQQLYFPASAARGRGSHGNGDGHGAASTRVSEALVGTSGPALAGTRDLAFTETSEHGFAGTPEHAFTVFLGSLGLDASDPHLRDTPARVARSYAELFGGLAGPAPQLTTFPNDEGASALVVVGGIRFYSMCAHHFLPFFGRAHVGYIPGERLVGLSKMARVVEYYARRPQVQERMTEQIAALLQQETDAAGVVVFTEARHLCVEMRGVSKAGTLTSALAARGALQDTRAQQQFFERIRGARPAEEV